ncbi:polysaccharide pyruvyl transferase family protein [Campylobacter geochelonis]|uniref:Putative WfaX n=1 Tax=Campylobacter geochelonis TaxID=1780362 RepID=A0A128EFL6_9BACT|nr:polysaccharide pyruvyl transferase family protein [Campylobacter geochelonis]QKF71857.1 polysaccharide pyruvyl transferase [Campylobacter geochelonis]CZE47028.1 putative WfaX [Campylobacter geochelonis]CZE47393.1 putative WfaX [Campylobacter geochelonis]CZE50963.1 putative WfaX [Campylobacter geochelonis]
MKVGIFTLPLVNNYGGILQAYALNKALKNLGFETILINISIENSTKKLSKNYLKFLIAKYLLFFMKKYQNINFTAYKHHKDCKEFIKNEINPKTKKITTSKELLKFFKIKQFDACVLGSDQVFRPSYFVGFSEDFSLGFLNDDVIKIAYAASFGGEEFAGGVKNLERHIQNLAKFKAISVREKNGVKICNDVFKQNAVHVLDPTLLVDKSEFDILIKFGKSLADDKILTYILDKNKEKDEIIEKCSKNLATEIYAIDDDLNGNKVSVYEWVRAFSRAKMIITDSFHGCVFSIIFNKPFFVFINENRGNQRFYSLLEMFDIKDRIIKTIDDINLDNTINWQRVNEILKERREFSKEFLMQNLKAN